MCAYIHKCTYTSPTLIHCTLCTGDTEHFEWDVLQLHECSCGLCVCVCTCGQCVYILTLSVSVSHKLPLLSTVRCGVQQPPADPAWPGAGARVEVLGFAPGGGLCPGSQAARCFPENRIAWHLFCPNKKCYFQRGAEARGS